MTTQFTRQAARPPGPKAYQALARKLRDHADDLDALATASSRQDKDVTRVLYSLERSVRSLRQRHGQKGGRS